MIAEQEILLLKEVIYEIIYDFQNLNINNFHDFLKHYESTIDEVESSVNEYCSKIKANQFEKIERFEKVIMLNALALYMIELNISQIPEGALQNQILAIFVEKIRQYALMKRGYLKLMGTILISEITSHTFVQVSCQQKKKL